MRNTILFIALLALPDAASTAQTTAPESTRSLTGALSFGWLATDAREIYSERQSNPFTTVAIDYHDTLLNPEFFRFRLQPRFSTGYLDALTGMSEGSGLAFDAEFLPRRPFPFRFHYSRFQRTVLTQGLGTTYSRFKSSSHDSNLGFEWILALPHYPQFELSFNKVDVATLPELVLTQGFETRSQTLSLFGQDSRWGWALSGNAYFQKLDTQYLLGSNDAPLELASHADIRNANFSAQRNIRKGLDFQATMSRTANQTEFDQGLFDQTFNSISAKLDFRPSDKLQAWTQLRDNQSSIESRSSLVSGTRAFEIPRSEVSTLIFDNEVRYQLHPRLSLLGRSEFTRVGSPAAQLDHRDGNFLNTIGGAQFFRPGRKLSLSAAYYLNASQTNFERISSGNLLGHTVDAFISLGTLETIRATASTSLSRSNENVRSFLPYLSSSEMYRLALSRGFARWCTIEIQGSLSSNRFSREELRSGFKGGDYGANLTGRGWQLGYSHSYGSGDSIQRLVSSGPANPVDLLPPLALTASASSKSTSANAALNLTRSIHLRGVWRKQDQLIGALLSSRFEEREATFDWQFRKLRFEASYLLYRYEFGIPIFRQSLVVRITRDFRVL